MGRGCGVEEAVGTMGLTAQMVLYGPGAHPQDAASRVAAELDMAVKHYQRMEGGTPLGHTP